MGPIGVPEMIFIFVLALLIFGPRKLPELGRNLGKALAEFRRASTDLRRTVEDEMRNFEEEARQLERQATDVDSNGSSATASAAAGPIAPPASEPPRYEEKPTNGDVKPA